MREVAPANGGFETMVSDVRQAVARIEATLTATFPHFTTKAEVAYVKVEMTEIVKTLPHLATKAELAEKPRKPYLLPCVTHSAGGTSVGRTT